MIWLKSKHDNEMDAFNNNSKKKMKKTTADHNNNKSETLSENALVNEMEAS